ncbi:hypothetical protein ACHAXR_003352 [Thalassiosira sp. AJA248-18]
MDRSSRRIRPSSPPPAPAPRKNKLHHEHTASTSASSSSSRRGSYQSSDERLQELKRKICPVTGVPRDISADYIIFSTMLGKGHYGCVRECEHKHRRDRTRLAVKSVDKSKIRRLDHLRREVQLLHQMEHHGIMKLIDCYEDAQFVHFVTERYTGGELFDKISQNTSPNGCLSEEKATGIIKSLLEAVAYLHANDIVHRDIKPENILFETTKEDSPIKLIDFGLSRRHSPGEAPMNNPVGTAYYMSPELLNGENDKSCDVWSVGTIAYILLCGYPPFNGETDPDIFNAIKEGHFNFLPEQAWSDKSDLAKDFIKCLLRRDPRKRFTAEEALGHPWLRGNSDKKETDADAKKHEDLMAKIQALRMTVQKLKNRSYRKESA